MVPVLRRTDGSDESGRTADRAGWRDAGRHLAANGEAIVLHARPAQAAFSAALGCGQQSRATVWADLPRALAAGSRLPACVRESAVHEWRRELGVADSGD